MRFMQGTHRARGRDDEGRRGGQSPGKDLGLQLAQTQTLTNLDHWFKKPEVLLMREK